MVRPVLMVDTEQILKPYTGKQSIKQTQMKMVTIFIPFTDFNQLIVM